MKDRLVRLEAVVRNLPLDSDKLAITMEVNLGELENLKLVYYGLARDVGEKMGSVLDDVSYLARELRGSIGAIENDVGLLKHTVSNASVHSKAGPTKINVPEPKPFGGTLYAKKLENFLLDVEQYFKATRVPEEEQVSIASMYLIRDEKHWWRSRL